MPDFSGGDGGHMSAQRQKFAQIDGDIDGKPDGKITAAELGLYLEKTRLQSHGPDIDNDGALKHAFQALYRLANPLAKMPEDKNIVLNEAQSANLLYYLPRYRSESLAKSDWYFAAQCKNDDNTNKSDEPKMTFASIVRSDASVMTYQDFAAAYRQHIHYQSQDRALELLQMVVPDGKEQAKSATNAGETKMAINFREFESIYSKL